MSKRTKNMKEKPEGKPLGSKILEHLKRVDLYYLGHLGAMSRYSTDFPNKKLFRQLSREEKKQYRMWAKKAFWMQHAAVGESANRAPFNKILGWIVAGDAFIRSWRKLPQQRRRLPWNVVVEFVPDPNHSGYMTPFGEFPSERAWLEFDLQRLSTICAAHTPPIMPGEPSYHAGRKAAIKEIEKRLAVLAKEDPGQESLEEWDRRGGSAPYDHETYQRERERRGVDCWPT
jgi:hypothetical protein